MDPASKPRFGQMWVWRWLPDNPMMYVSDRQMLVLPDKKMTREAFDRHVVEMTNVTDPANWTLLEDVDAEQG